MDDKEINELCERIFEAHEKVAEARKELALADFRYRHWKAVVMEDVATKNRKYPEWRTKATTESQPAFAAHKAAIADAREVYDLCDAECKMLLAKALLIAAAHGINLAHWFMSADEHT